MPTMLGKHDAARGAVRSLSSITEPLFMGQERAPLEGSHSQNRIGQTLSSATSSAGKRERSSQTGGTFGGTAPHLSSSLCPFHIQNLEPTAGFGPATRCLQNSCSAS